MSAWCSEQGVDPVRSDKNRGMKSKKGRRWEELRNSEEKRKTGTTRRSLLVREEKTSRLPQQC